MLTLLSTSLATFLLWGVAGNATAGVMAFGTMYGLFAGGWSCLWTGFVRPLASTRSPLLSRPNVYTHTLRDAEEDPARATSLFGLLLLSRGLGNIISTPIATALSAHTSDTARGGSGFAVDGGRYGGMIVYVGTCFAGAATLALGIWAKERGMARRAVS
jgi:MCP family monocarboxylic acid transporter-like MFS transporter 10